MHPKHLDTVHNVTVENEYHTTVKTTYDAWIQHKATEQSRIEEAVFAI